MIVFIAGIVVGVVVTFFVFGITTVANDELCELQAERMFAKKQCENCLYQLEYCEGDESDTAKEDGENGLSTP